MVFSKQCAKCSKHNNNPMNEDLSVPEHCCVKNFEGSSGTMEPQACVDIATELHDKCQVNIRMIRVDDDATTRSAIRWNNADCLINNNTDVLPQVPITKGPNKGDP